MATRSRARVTMAWIAGILALVAGCGTPPDVDGSVALTTAPPETTDATTEPADEDTEPRSDPSPAEPTSPESAEDDATQLCTSADLALSLGEGDAGGGWVWRPLQFTNTGGAACEIQGFPGVSYVAGDDGHQVGPAAYRDGSKGDPITLDPGETAYAGVGFAQVGVFDPDECLPTEVRGLRVYPPQETRSMYLENPGTGCGGDDIPESHLKVQSILPGQGPG